MKVSTVACATILTFASFAVATADARDRCTGYACKDYPTTSTTLEIAVQYANGGQFGGVTSGATATTLDIARDSVDFFGAPQQLYVSPWRGTPAVAKGN